MLKEVSALKIFKTSSKTLSQRSNRIAFWTNCVRRQVKSKRKFFVKIIKRIIKGNTGQTALSFNQNIKLLLCFFINLNSCKRKKCWTRSNKINSFLKKIKTFLKGQYGSNRIVPDSYFLKIFETEKNWRIC